MIQELLLYVRLWIQMQLSLNSRLHWGSVLACLCEFMDNMFLQVVQSDSEEADGSEGAGQRAELCRHRCEDPGEKVLSGVVLCYQRRDVGLVPLTVSSYR